MQSSLRFIGRRRPSRSPGLFWADRRRGHAAVRRQRPAPARRRGSSSSPAVDDHVAGARALARSRPRPRRRSPSDDRRQLGHALAVAGVHDLEHERLVALRLDRLLGHEQRVLPLGERQAHAREQARPQLAVVVVDLRAHDHRAAGGIDQRVRAPAPCRRSRDRDRRRSRARSSARAPRPAGRSPARGSRP